MDKFPVLWYKTHSVMATPIKKKHPPTQLLIQSVVPMSGVGKASLTYLRSNGLFNDPLLKDISDWCLVPQR